MDVLDSLIAFLDPETQEDLMTKLTYRPKVKDWWRIKFFNTFGLRTVQMEFDSWKDLYKFFVKYGPRNVLRMVKDENVEHLEILLQLGLLTKDDEFMEEDFLYVYLRACEKNETNIVNFISEHYDFEIKTKFEFGLYLACAQKNIDTVKALLKEGQIEQSSDSCSSLIKSIELDKIDIVKLLLGDRDKGETVESGYGDVTAQGYLPIKLAFDKNSEPLIKLLYSHLPNISIDFENGYGVRRAAELKNEVIMKFLIGTGADISINNNEALKVAARLGYQPIINLLLANQKPGVDKMQVARSLIVNVAPAENIKLANALIKELEMGEKQESPPRKLKQPRARSKESDSSEENPPKKKKLADDKKAKNVDKKKRNDDSESQEVDEDESDQD